MIFAGQPSNLGGGSGPQRPSRYFRLLIVNPGRPPLPPNRLYCRPFNYLEYVKDFDLDVDVKKFKDAIKANGETEDAKIVELFNVTIINTIYDWCNNYMGYYPYCTFV